jgi:hypothetical protein
LKDFEGVSDSESDEERRGGIVEEGRRNLAVDRRTTEKPNQRGPPHLDQIRSDLITYSGVINKLLLSEPVCATSTAM